MYVHSDRILVVDDDPDIRANLSDILGDYGYAVDLAADGPEALALIAKEVYDLALIDLRMPGMDGLELYRRIKTLQPGIVAVIITAYAASETAQDAEDVGAWHVVAKPVDAGALMPIIESILKRPLVILVDDDEELSASLWDVLQHHQYRVCLASDMNEAKRLLGCKDFQIALIDMKLPNGDGCEVQRLVKKNNPQAHVVLMTGCQLELHAKLEQALSDGADAVYYKPIDVAKLIGTLEALTANA